MPSPQKNEADEQLSQLRNNANQQVAAVRDRIRMLKNQAMAEMRNDASSELQDKLEENNALLKAQEDNIKNQLAYFIGNQPIPGTTNGGNTTNEDGTGTLPPWQNALIQASDSVDIALKSAQQSVNDAKNVLNNINMNIVPASWVKPTK